VIVDVNVSLSRWPCRRLKGEDTAELVAKLRGQGVVQAWAGSFDALLHRDVADVNRRLVEECRRFGHDFLLPFGTVNPLSPDWEEDLRRCQEEHHMPGLRLYPNYHGYRLDQPMFAELLKAVERRGLIVQLAVKMEDERAAHPLLRVAPVDTTPLLRLLPDLPRLRLILLNGPGAVPPEPLRRLRAAGQVYFDIAMVEGLGGIGKMLEAVTADRVLFGSHFPFYNFESALLKLRESPLEPLAKKAIEEGNARRLQHKD
jgi:predicted TIM-barrel fold metal-dependent hydrolase